MKFSRLSAVNMPTHSSAHSTEYLTPYQPEHQPEHLPAYLRGHLSVIILPVLVLSFVALLIVTTNRLSAIQREGADQYLASNLRTVSATVDQSLKSLEFSHSIIFQDTAFLNAVKRLVSYDVRDEYSDFLNTRAIKTRIGEVAATNDYIDSIFAYSFRAERVFSSRVNWDPAFNHFPAEPSEWLLTHRANGQKNPWCITRDLRVDQVIISSYREIWVYGDPSPIGLLSINVDAGVIAHMLDEVTPEAQGYTFIVDGKNNIISNQRNTDSEIFKQIMQYIPAESTDGSFSFRLNDEKMFSSFYTSPYSGFTYVIATSLDRIQTSVPIMQQLIFFFLLLIAALTAVAILLLYRLLSMIKNTHRLTLENYTSKLINKEAKLRNIQDQLNEHFLYNTLDSIHWLSRSGNNSQVCDMVFALANFYRQSLSSGKEVIPVSDVIEMLKNYLFIQKIRMRATLSYTIFCEPGLTDELIPKTLLQPLVENAIMHGFKGISHTGYIEVSFHWRNENETMRVTVKDNGSGFAPEKLKQVRKQLELQNPYCEDSFALKTVQSQAQFFYGEDIRLHIDTVAGAGTAIWLDLPLKEGANGNIPT